MYGMRKRLDVRTREALVSDNDIVRPEYAIMNGQTADEWLRIQWQDDFNFPSRELVADLDEWR